MILLLDNYDSFTYNIVQSIQRLGTEEVKVIRSKEITIQEIEKLKPSHLVIGPGLELRILLELVWKQLNILQEKFQF